VVKHPRGRIRDAAGLTGTADERGPVDLAGAVVACCRTLTGLPGSGRWSSGWPPRRRSEGCGCGPRRLGLQLLDRFVGVAAAVDGVPCQRSSGGLPTTWDVHAAGADQVNARRLRAAELNKRQQSCCPPPGFVSISCRQGRRTSSLATHHVGAVTNGARAARSRRCTSGCVREASAVAHEPGDPGCRVFGRFVFPHSDSKPAGVGKTLVCLAVATLVAFDLGRPVIRIGLRCSASVLWATVPEAAVNEYGHAGGPEHQVCPSADSGKGSGVHSIAQTRRVQCTSQRQLRRGVAGALSLHTPAHRDCRRPRRRRVATGNAFRRAWSTRSYSCHALSLLA
jgi:hypothetical protein